MNILVCIFSYTCVCIFAEYITGVKLLSRRVDTCSALGVSKHPKWMRQFVLSQQCTRAPIAPHPSLHLVSSAFIILAPLVRVWYYLTVALIYIPLMANEVVHFFVCLCLFAMG